MSLYDDIQPTMQRSYGGKDDRDRGRDLYQSVSNGSSSKQSGGDSANRSGNMFAPRTLLHKKPQPHDSRSGFRPAPSTLQSVPVPSVYSSHPMASTSIPAPGVVPDIKMDELKAKIAAARAGMSNKFEAPGAGFQPVKAPLGKISNIMPIDVRDTSQNLFDEVHIVDEYDAKQPNDYTSFMASIGCSAQFGEEIDDSRLERLIVSEIVKGQHTRERTPSPEPEQVQKSASTRGFGMKMMAKMGFTEGSGLGKHGQGMAQALRVEKAGGHSGRIVSELDELIEYHKMDPELVKPKISNILLLRNMYTNDDFTEDFEREVRPELEKYGPVRRIVLKRAESEPDPSEQIRLFADFHNQKSAFLALVGLSNRFFSERIIRADFYPSALFYANDFSYDV